MNITFTQSSGGSTAVTIAANIVFGTLFNDTRLNQHALETADGGMVVYDNGPNLVQGLIVMKNVSYSDGQNLYTWIRDTIVFSKQTFTISALSGVNLGLGDNTAITLARWNNEKTTEGVFELVAPKLWNINFPYRFVR